MFCCLKKKKLRCFLCLIRRLTIKQLKDCPRSWTASGKITFDLTPCVINQGLCLCPEFFSGKWLGETKLLTFETSFISIQIFFLSVEIALHLPYLQLHLNHIIQHRSYFFMLWILVFFDLRLHVICYGGLGIKMNLNRLARWKLCSHSLSK